MKPTRPPPPTPLYNVDYRPAYEEPALASGSSSKLFTGKEVSDTAEKRPTRPSPSPLHNIDYRSAYEEPPLGSGSSGTSFTGSKVSEFTEKRAPPEKLESICETCHCHKADTATISDASTYSGYTTSTSQSDLYSSASSVQVDLSSCTESSNEDRDDPEATPTAKSKTARGGIWPFGSKNLKKTKAPIAQTVTPTPLTTAESIVTNDNASIFSVGTKNSKKIKSPTAQTATPPTVPTTVESKNTNDNASIFSVVTKCSKKTKSPTTQTAAPPTVPTTAETTVKNDNASIFSVGTKSSKKNKSPTTPQALPINDDASILTASSIAPSSAPIKTKHFPKVLRRKVKRAKSTPNLNENHKIKNAVGFLSPEDLGKVNAYYAPVPHLPKTPMTAHPAVPTRALPPVPTRPLPVLPLPMTPTSLLPVGFPVMPESSDDNAGLYMTLDQIDWSTGNATLLLLDGASARARREEGSLAECAVDCGGGRASRRRAHTSIGRDEWKRMGVPDKESSFLAFD